MVPLSQPYHGSRRTDRSSFNCKFQETFLPLKTKAQETQSDNHTRNVAKLVRKRSYSDDEALDTLTPLPAIGQRPGLKSLRSLAAPVMHVGTLLTSGICRHLINEYKINTTNNTKVGSKYYVFNHSKQIPDLEKNL